MSFIARTIAVYLCVGATLMPLSALGETARVAVAANFAGALEALSQSFSEQTGHELVPVMGATGLLFAQIKQGAPIDVFLAADAERPAELEKLGVIPTGSRFTYALGRLALWMPGSIRKPEISELSPQTIDRFGIANARLAPYGAAAEQVLENLGGVDTWRYKLVYGLNIGATYSMIASGNVDAGMVALSQLLDQQVPDIEYSEVPQALYAPIRQDAVLTQRGVNNPAAQAFMKFLMSETAIGIIARAGYGTIAEGGVSD